MSPDTQALRAYFPCFDRAARAAAAREHDPRPPGAAEAEAELARARLRAEAFEAGFAEAQRAAAAARAETLAEPVKALTAAAEHLALQRTELAAQLEGALPALILEIARAVIHTEIEHSRPALEALVRDISARVAGDGRPLTVRLGPLAAAAFHEAHDVGSEAVKVESDPRLGPADFVLEAPDGFVDGRLDVKLDEAWRALTESRP